MILCKVSACYSETEFKTNLGRYDNTLPKFRYTGTAPSGVVHPVILETEKINVDVVTNGGVFLCLKPGFYQFVAALSAAHDRHAVGLWVVHNSREQVYVQ